MPLTKVRILILTVFALGGIGFLAPVYANEGFEKFAEAITKKVSKIEFEELINQYRGERLDGYAYVVSITKDITGDTTVNLSTKRDFSSSDTVNIVVFLRKHLAGRKLKIKEGRRFRFMGIFEEIRMNTLILKEGLVK
ncbi:MAG: hypothetical protein KKH93_04050 [Candidatus Omnitrophica bacterium]|nr:hypothetical protein [Candidatus Omnitrophota bacterium]